MTDLAPSDVNILKDRSCHSQLTLVRLLLAVAATPEVQACTSTAQAWERIFELLVGDDKTLDALLMDALDFLFSGKADDVAVGVLYNGLARCGFPMSVNPVAGPLKPDPIRQANVPRAFDWDDDAETFIHRQIFPRANVRSFRRVHKTLLMRDGECPNPQLWVLSIYDVAEALAKATPVQKDAALAALWNFLPGWAVPSPAGEVRWDTSRVQRYHDWLNRGLVGGFGRFQLPYVLDDLLGRLHGTPPPSLLRGEFNPAFVSLFIPALLSIPGIPEQASPQEVEALLRRTSFMRLHWSEPDRRQVPTHVVLVSGVWEPAYAETGT